MAESSKLSADPGYVTLTREEYYARYLDSELPEPSIIEVSDASVDTELLCVPTDNDDGEWRTRALCRGVDPNVFFPSSVEGVIEAARICGSCAVKAECLEEAIVKGEEHGVWGGASERERRRIKRRRRAGHI